MSREKAHNAKADLTPFVFAYGILDLFSCCSLRGGEHIVLVRIMLELALAWPFLVCTISCEPVVGFLSIFFSFFTGLSGSVGYASDWLSGGC